MPSGTARTAAPSPTTAGMPSARARIAACAVAPPRAVAMAWVCVGVEPDRLGRRELVGDDDAGALRRGRRGRAGERGEDAARDVLDVDGALAQVGVVEPAEGVGGLVGGRAPGRAGRLARGDPALGAGR